MSTSPSWFDQEKFSRLVKKVAPKTVTESLPNSQGPDNAGGDNPASTSRISLVSKPPSLITEHRALPALPRRTAPLPRLKPAFNFPPISTPAAKAAETATTPDESKIDDAAKESAGISVEDRSDEEESELAETWHKMGLLNEELARAIHERDQALQEGVALREQLLKTEEPGPATTPDLARVIKERDDAMAELELLKSQAAGKQEVAKDLRSPTQSQELTLLAEERDQARKQYFAIRKDYEELKEKATLPPTPAAPAPDLEKELAEIRLQLAERDSEISALKSAAAAPKKTGPLPTGGDEKLKEELALVREQLTRSRDEASIAQRGLALSQKALHETRDALREATEGTSLSRHNFDNLKNECATLSQQNAVLQSKNDQLLKDLAAAKGKITGRL